MSEQLKLCKEALEAFKKLWKAGNNGMYNLDRNAAYEWCAHYCEIIESTLDSVTRPTPDVVGDVVEPFPGWRPINTVPKDGTDVILGIIDEDGDVIALAKDYWYADRVMADWESWNEFYDQPPTHWMVLPNHKPKSAMPEPQPVSMEKAGDVVERAAANVYGEHNDHDHLGNPIPWESASPQRKEIMRRRAKAALSATPQGKALPSEDEAVEIMALTYAIESMQKCSTKHMRAVYRALLAATPQPQTAPQGKALPRGDEKFDMQTPMTDFNKLREQESMQERRERMTAIIDELVKKRDAENDALAQHLTDRFLGWKLPDDFHPDCGIQFDAFAAKKLDPRNAKYEPVGTNLFTATQAKAMFLQLLRSYATPQPQPVTRE